MVGRDQQPLDLSQEKSIKLIQESMGLWRERMQNDKQGNMYGYPDLLDLKPLPYGEPYKA